MVTLDLIRQLITELPGAHEERSYGTPGFKVKKKLFARIHQKEDAIVVVLDSIRERDELIRSNPILYYITDHYTNYAAVLVRPIVNSEEFRKLLVRAWRHVASKADIAEYEARS